MRKIKDHYYKMAKEQDFSARSAFKLKEIDDKYHIVKKGMDIMDLGASPGSWTEYVHKKIQSSGRIVSVDLKPLNRTFPENITVIEGDVFNLSDDQLPATNMKFDLLMSDMAPNTSGNKGLNHQQSLDLCRKVVELCDIYLKPGKNLICKVFQGEDLQEFLLEEVKPRFNKYKLVKPKSTRKESVEMFIVAFEYKELTE